jgi:hypothetical protein
MAPKDQQPQHDHQGQVEAAKGGGVNPRERHKQHAAGGDQPDLVAVPDRPDGREHRPTLRVRPRDQAVQNANAEIETV